MKKIIFSLVAISLMGRLVSAVAQDTPGDNNPPPPPEMGGTAIAPGGDAGGPPPPDMEPVTTDQPAAPTAVTDTANPPTEAATTDETATNAESEVILPGTSKTGSGEDVAANYTPPATGTNADELRLNFRNAPLELVLNYLSDAAGFIIVLDTRVNGNVSVISSHPMTRDEAVDLLNAVLNKNGYAAIRDGRTLTIVDKNDAKTREIPVKTGNNPDEIPRNAEIVTQIIPIRFVEARQLVSDLTSFVSPQATVVANEAGNSIVITDTQQNIRHLTEIIRAIDNSAQSETEIRVFHLKHASPADVASELTSIFPSGSGSTTQSPIRFGGGGGGPGGFFQRMMGGGGGNNDSSANDRIKKATQVSAVADSRIQSVIVTAPKDLMEQIAGMMNDLDVPSTRDQQVYVFHMNNGDPQQAAQVLQTMFQTSGSRSSSSGSSANSALMQRAQNNATTTTSSSSGSSGFGGSSGGRGGGAGGLQF
jgi:type II secretory pathway component GspD/PulD (secretin)